METITSVLNGIQMNRHPGISGENWQKVKNQMLNTEGGRLVRATTQAVEPPKVASGNSFAMPQNGAIEFEADRIKAEKKAEAEKISAPAKRGRKPKDADADSIVA